MRPALVLVGGGGHCRSCIDVIEAEGRYAISGIVDAKENAAAGLSGYPILGNDEELPALAAAGHEFLITLGQIKTASHRVRLWELLKRLRAVMAIVRSPEAYVSKGALIGAGTIIMHRAVLNAGAKVGENCIVNTLALIEHDAVVADHCHVSTGAVINGDCRIGPRTFIGSSSTVSNQVEVGAECVVGAGSLVAGDLAGPGVFAGSPVRRLGAK